MNSTKILLLFLISLLSCLDPSQTQNKDVFISKMAAGITKQFPQVPQLSIDDYLKDKSQYLLVDARDDKEIAISIIADSISLKDFNSQLQNYKNKKIVFYCTIGQRSSETAQDFQRKGFQAYNLEEGVLGWAQRGLSFEKDGRPVKKVHVYAEAWNVLPKEYQGVWK